jgi:hypothetical protein
MHRPRTTALFPLFLAFALPAGQAASPQKSLDEQIAGAWTYVAVDTVRPDGSRTPMYGANPQGLVIFDGHGHYALVNARADLPKFASNNRMEGTPQEYQAIAQGSIAHFGSYTINEADKTITFRIEASTFPNWDGAVQKRPLTLAGDELRWMTPAASGGGSGEVVLRRAK